MFFLCPLPEFSLCAKNGKSLISESLRIRIRATGLNTVIEMTIFKADIGVAVSFILLRMSIDKVRGHLVFLQEY